jgi:phosphotransferase system HPr (HPr) family protein
MDAEVGPEVPVIPSQAGAPGIDDGGAGTVADTDHRASRLLVVTNPSGLHARPAALFVRTAAEFRSAIRVRNATRGGPGVNAKGILGILTISVSNGHEIEISAQGEDQDAALDSLVALVESGIGEAPAG